jgi:hypothetical protein
MNTVRILGVAAMLFIVVGTTACTTTSDNSATSSPKVSSEATAAPSEPQYEAIDLPDTWSGYPAPELDIELVETDEETSMSSLYAPVYAVEEAEAWTEDMIAEGWSVITETTVEGNYAAVLQKDGLYALCESDKNDQATTFTIFESDDPML